MAKRWLSIGIPVFSDFLRTIETLERLAQELSEVAGEARSRGSTGIENREAFSRVLELADLCFHLAEDMQEGLFGLLKRATPVLKPEDIENLTDQVS